MGSNSRSKGENIVEITVLRDGKGYDVTFNGKTSSIVELRKMAYSAIERDKGISRQYKQQKHEC